MHLSQVTLVAVTGVARAATARAMSACLGCIRFGDAIFLSDRPAPKGQHPEIRHISIAPIESRLEYSAFMLKELAKHVTTEFALCVQWDGYVLNALNWQPEFLNYDYIGAPWPQFDDGHTVGNGGFSLRSRRLLEAAAELVPAEGLAEDIAICRTYRDRLEQSHSIRFAPERLASMFSFERTPPNGREFGFHGVFNLAKLVSLGEFESILSGLEPGLLGRRESRELLKFAAKRGNFRLLRTLVRKITIFGSWDIGFASDKGCPG